MPACEDCIEAFGMVRLQTEEALDVGAHGPDAL